MHYPTDNLKRERLIFSSYWEKFLVHHDRGSMEEKLGTWKWEPVTEAGHITVGQQAECKGQETGTGCNLQSPTLWPYSHYLGATASPNSASYRTNIQTGA